jgi:hypothetical protein
VAVQIARPEASSGQRTVLRTLPPDRAAKCHAMVAVDPPAPMPQCQWWLQPRPIKHAGIGFRVAPGGPAVAGRDPETNAGVFYSAGLYLSETPPRARPASTAPRFEFESALSMAMDLGPGLPQPHETRPLARSL